VAEREGVAGLEPTEVGDTAVGGAANFQHDSLLGSVRIRLNSQFVSELVSEAWNESSNFKKGLLAKPFAVYDRIFRTLVFQGFSRFLKE
jgi:hypothetical protein